MARGAPWPSFLCCSKLASSSWSTFAPIRPPAAIRTSLARRSRALASANIAYDWQGAALGGMRPQGYLAHMQTPAFEQAARALVATAGERRVCIMCAESDPADCHRSHVSDWLVAQGERVVHVIAEDDTREHAARLF